MRLKQRFKGRHIKQRNIAAGYYDCSVKISRQRIQCTFNRAASTRNLILMSDGYGRKKITDVLSERLFLVANYRNHVRCI